MEVADRMACLVPIVEPEILVDGTLVKSFCIIMYYEPNAFMIMKEHHKEDNNAGIDVITGTVGEMAELAISEAYKGSQVDISSTPDQCVYPRSPALALGTTAALALLIAHAIINVETGCGCCRHGPRPSGSNWTLALICFGVSWFTFVIAFLLFLTGAALNDQHGEESLVFGTYYCYVVKPGVFAGGAVLSLACVLLDLIYYLTLSSTKNTSPGEPSNQHEIALGQPQLPPSTAQDPVFVHEDTYMRRQFT